MSYNQEICGNIFYCGKFLCAALNITLVHNHTNILSASDILNMYFNSQVSCWGAAPGSVWHLLLAVLWSRKKVSGHQPEWADKRQTRSMTNKAKRRKKAGGKSYPICMLFVLHIPICTIISLVLVSGDCDCFYNLWFNRFARWCTSDQTMSQL